MGRPFPPGTSGNPSGRPKAVVAVQELAKEHTLDAIKALADVCRDEKAPPSARVAASTALLDRAWGRPSQAVEIGGSGVPIEGVMRIEFVKVDQIEVKAG